MIDGEIENDKNILEALYINNFNLKRLHKLVYKSGTSEPAQKT